MSTQGSAVTVGDILTLAVFDGAYVLAGSAGLDRAVTGVNVMEVPDIEAYVAHGELLLTTAYPVRDRPERLVELLPVLASQGLAGLAIKPLRYIEHLPDNLAEEADRLGFPVLIVPARTSFNEVIGAVLAVVLAEYGAEPGRAEAIRERLTGVALAGGGLEEIARTLAGALDRDVQIDDDHGNCLGQASPRRPGAEVDQPGSTGPADPAPTPWSFPITVAGKTRGRVRVGGADEPTLGQRRLIRQSCFAAGMHIAQALASLELDRRLRTLFLEELVTGTTIDVPALQQRSRLFGWDIAGAHVVLLAQCSTELTDSAVLAAVRTALPHDALAWTRGSEVITIIPVPGLDVAPGIPGAALGPIAHRWRAALLDAGASVVTVAVGSCVDIAAQIADSHTNAREALGIALRTDRAVVDYQELELERLLLAVPLAQLHLFVEREIGLLIRNDTRTGSELCTTLEAYLGSGNAAEAARNLYIHYNTMKHRLARITELTKFDLHDPRTRLAIVLALRIHDLVGGSPPPLAAATGGPDRKNAAQ